MNVVIHKKTGTYADALEAVGVAHLYQELGFTGVTIRDAGPNFEVSAKTAPQSWSKPTPGFPYIWEQTKEPEAPAYAWIVDYEKEKEKREVFKKFKEAQKRARNRTQQLAADQDIETPPPPSPEFAPAAILASMRKGWNGDRDLCKWILSNPEQTVAWLRHCLNNEAAPPEIPGISNTQILNPSAGKGIHFSKTKASSPGSLPPVLVESFPEWMKFRGLWVAMLPMRSGDDFKFFVIEPSNIAIAGLAEIHRQLRDLNLWGGIRLDIEAALRCTELLIRNSDVLQPAASTRISLRNLAPRSVIAGLRQAFFKSLGNAAALMNDALLPLPDWFTVRSEEDAEDYLAIIDEAIGTFAGGARTAGCLSSLSEEHSDDGAVFQAYRRWLLDGQLLQLLNFHHSFANHAVQRLATSKWVKLFSTEILQKLLIKSYSSEYPMLKEIIDRDEFRSVANAIRNCTILALKHKRREVHFGLAQRWKQKMRAGNTDFATELADFVQTQNWEAAHGLKGKAHMVSTEDLNAVIAMVDAHGAELVGSLLLAFGYAYGPKKEDPDQAQTVEPAIAAE